MVNRPSLTPRYEPLSPSEIGSVNQKIDSYAAIFVRRLKDGEEFKPESDRRRQLSADQIIAVLDRQPADRRFETYTELMQEVARQWNDSINEALRRADIEQSPRTEKAKSNGLVRLDALVKSTLHNKLDAALQTQKDVEDARRGVHHELTEGAGI